MKLQATRTLEEAVSLPTTPLWIEGVGVEALFEEVYRGAQAQAAARNVTLRFDVIAWEPLVAAADRAVLSALFRALVEDALAATEAGGVLLRAYPVQDNTGVMFEVQDDRADSRGAGRRFAWKTLVDGARTRIARMGGELDHFRREEGGQCVCFWLPQWVTCDLDEFTPLEHAA